MLLLTCFKTHNMANTLKVTLVQTQLHWEDPEANRAHFTTLIQGISTPTDLIVLPEMFTTGFSMNAAPFAELQTGPTVRWMRNLASQKQVAITGSLMIKQDNKFYNRLIFVHPNGQLETYNKRHTFTLAGEQKVFSAGDSHTIITYKGFKICPLICYDLRFPVWARNTMDYDLLLYVANWPKIRTNAWDALLKARAIENMAYCIGVNRIGTDGLGFEYTGHSAAYSPLGELLSTSNLESEFKSTVELDKESMLKTREKLGFLNDQDLFSLLE